MKIIDELSMWRKPAIIDKTSQLIPFLKTKPRFEKTPTPLKSLEAAWAKSHCVCISIRPFKAGRIALSTTRRSRRNHELKCPQNCEGSVCRWPRSQTFLLRWDRADSQFCSIPQKLAPSRNSKILKASKFQAVHYQRWRFDVGWFRFGLPHHGSAGTGLPAAS